MNKTLLILRYELINTIKRKSFIFTTIGLPIISVIILMVVTNINRRAPQVLSSVVGERELTSISMSDGYVDPGRVIQSIPESVPQGALIVFENDAAAQQALEAGEIWGYFIIAPDYLKTGQVIYITPDFNPLTAFDKTGLMQWVLRGELALR